MNAMGYPFPVAAVCNAILDYQQMNPNRGELVEFYLQSAQLFQQIP